MSLQCKLDPVLYREYDHDAAWSSDSMTIADLHIVVIWLQLPEFLSTFLYYLKFEVPERFKQQDRKSVV